MSGADHFVLGDWNVRCDRCGKKIKGSQARQTWQGYWVCQQHWEPRHPQDFVRAIVEHPTPAFVREPPDVILPAPCALTLEPDGEDNYIGLESGGWIISEGDCIIPILAPILTEDFRPITTESSLTLTTDQEFP